MLRPKILSAVLVVVPAALLLTARVGLSEPQAQECRANPGSSTPRGGHWYYRINHADKQRCWYLGPVDARSSGRGTASLISTPVPVPQKKSVSEAAPSTSSQGTPEENASRQFVAAQAAPTEIAFLRSSPRTHEGRMGFGARWPENLPDAQDVSGQDSESTEPSSPSNSYAESRTELGAPARMPLRWPVVDADDAGQISAIETVLRSFSIAGGLLMVALLVGGWAAGAIAARVGPRRRVDFAEATGGTPAATPYGPERAGVPTDPAQDLKTSLAELMHDLHRAEAAGHSGWSAKRRASRYHEDADRHALAAVP